MLLDPAQPAVIGIGSGTCRVAQGRALGLGARGHCDTGRGACHPTMPRAPSPHPCPLPPSWGTAYSSSPAWSAPKAPCHLVLHEAQPSSPCTAPNPCVPPKLGQGWWLLSQHLLKPPGWEGMVTCTGFTRGIAAQPVPSWHCPEGQGVGQSSHKDLSLPGALPARGRGHWDKKTLHRCWGHCRGKEPCKDREGGPAAS